MTQTLLEDPIPESIKELLSIFKNDLSAVTFPDISADVLENFANQVRTKALELQEAHARVLSMKEALDASQSELLQRATRALAYAKLYAEDREELQKKLSTVSLTGKTTGSRLGSEKRTRTRKSIQTEIIPKVAPEDVSETTEE